LAIVQCTSTQLTSYLPDHPARLDQLVTLQHPSRHYMLIRLRWFICGHISSLWSSGNLWIPDAIVWWRSLELFSTSVAGCTLGALEMSHRHFIASCFFMLADFCSHHGCNRYYTWYFELCFNKKGRVHLPDGEAAALDQLPFRKKVSAAALNIMSHFPLYLHTHST
jgi:hypothetical protein